MKVSELAEKLQVPPDTVRFYTRIGLLQPRLNPGNGYKSYRQQDYLRLRFILTARNLGFSVKDIEHILAESDAGHCSCPLVREIIEKRLQETEQLFEQTLALRNRMMLAIDHWKDKPDMAPTGDMICHLIEEFATPMEAAQPSTQKVRVSQLKGQHHG